MTHHDRARVLAAAVPPSQTRATFDVLGAPIAVTSPDAMAGDIERWAADDIGRYVCIRDVASLMSIRATPALAAVHREAAAITPDGMPLVMIGKMRSLPVERTCGPDLLTTLCARSAGTGLRHYFYGGSPAAVAALVANLTARYPQIAIAGWESPPFGDALWADEDAARGRILASGADVVWVGMSSPRQDEWMNRNYRHLGQTLIGVGAAFDFHAGLVRRAPVWAQRSGMEWLFRLASEPRRLWRRYLVLGPRFVVLASGQLIGDHLRSGKGRGNDGGRGSA